MQNGLVEPQAIINATASYQTSGQILQIFFDSELVQESGAIVPLRMYYPLYAAWCTENGFMPMSREKINHYVRSKNWFKGQSTYNGKTERNILIGYRLKTEKDIVPMQAQCPF